MRMNKHTAPAAAFVDCSAIEEIFDSYFAELDAEDELSAAASEKFAVRDIQNWADADFDDLSF